MPKALHAERLAKACGVLAEKHLATASEESVKDLWERFQTSEQHTIQLELKLADLRSTSEKLQSDLAKSANKCKQLKEEVVLWKAKHAATYRELRTQRQATQRSQTREEKLQGQIKIFKKAEKGSSHLLNKPKQPDHSMARLQKENAKLHQQLSSLMSTWTTKLEKSRSKLEASGSSLKSLRREISNLHKANNRAGVSKERALAAAKKKAEKQRTIHHLTENGVITEQTRSIVRLLVKSGCSRNYISEVISAVFASAGITIKGNISHTSIAHILREGYFAAQIQLGYEMKQAESMTFSADGTGHRSINYNSLLRLRQESSRGIACAVD